MSDGPAKKTGWEEADRWFAPSARSTPPADGEGAEPPTPRCAVCGAELDPDQTYCLECGSPTPLAPRIRRPKTAYILAGAMVILGLGAGALAYAVANDDDATSAGSSTAPVLTAPTDTMPVVPLPPETGPSTGPLPPDTTFTSPTDTSGGLDTGGFDTGGFDTVTGPADTAPTTEETTTQSTPPTGSSAGDWPAGETAWTAILSSLGIESAATAAKSKLESQGEPAGVLFSSDFPDLRPGYWVVFSGTYSTKQPAVNQATKLRGEVPGAYAREISG